MKKVSDAILLKMWAQLVKKKAGDKCEYPGCTKTTHLNAHHYYSRRNAATRYDVLNGICLCSYHHSLGMESAHKDPNFKDVLISNGVRTITWHETITARKNTIVKNNQFFKESWKITLKMELEGYDTSRFY
jgi:hypothetical protein